MQATQISVKNLKRSTQVASRIREKCEQLERFHPRIHHCRVAIEQESARPGAAGPVNVTLRVVVPGGEVVVTEHDIHYHLALRKAFATARRQLKEAASLVRSGAHPGAKRIQEAA